MAYESPIEVIYKDIQRRMESGILKAVQECNIHVDRDELIRALQYDRGQYEKGYADGIAAAENAPSDRCKDCLVDLMTDDGK